MGDYIDRRKLLDEVIRYGVDLSTSELFDFIFSAPSENVVFSRRGKWTPLWGGKGMQCSRCNKVLINHFDSISRFKKECLFCPNCGSRNESEQLEPFTDDDDPLLDDIFGEC